LAQLSRSAYVRNLVHTASSSDQREAALRVELARSSRVFRTDRPGGLKAHRHPTFLREIGLLKDEQPRIKSA
jgi:hypothetical protein